MWHASNCEHGSQRTLHWRGDRQRREVVFLNEVMPIAVPHLQAIG
jgi:hypothetical protein